MIWTIPNILTIIRVLFIPVLVVSFHVPFLYHFYFSAFIFLLASLTDWVDGYLARYFKQKTKLGTFLDPVADKLIVVSSLCLLSVPYHYYWFSIPIIIIVCREILVSALREWMAEIGQRSAVKVSILGKVKTTCQMLSIFLLLLNPESFSNFWVITGFILLYISVILTIYSMWLYLLAAYVILLQKRY